MNRRVLGISLLLLSACGGPPEQDELESQGTDASGFTAVRRLDDGYTLDQGRTRGRFWIDLSVDGRTYEKDVGVVWTLDNWNTYRVSYASYEGALDNGREQWGVDIGSRQANDVLRYAAFADFFGQTYWDSHGNYQILSGPIMRSSVFLSNTPGGSLAVAGTVTLANLDPSKEVVVRYSVDRWRTRRDFTATVSGTQANFSIEGLCNPQCPAEVQVAIRYRAGGETYWDNNGGRNYRVAMRID